MPGLTIVHGFTELRDYDGMRRHGDEIRRMFKYVGPENHDVVDFVSEDEKRREYSNSNSKPCPHCGKSINKNNNVCFSCGHDFKKEKGFLRKLFSSKTKLCPACNEMNEEHFNYCKRCGYNFNTGSFGISDNTKSDMRKCSKCGALNSKDSNFCTECGKKLRN